MLTSAQRKARMLALVREIPADIERKEDPNELQVLRDQIVESVTGKIKAYKDDIEKNLAEMKAQGITDPEAEKRFALLVKRIEGLEAEMKRPDSYLPPVFQKSVGEQFTESNEYKDFIKRGWHRGGTALKFEGKHNPFFEGEGLHELKTTITSSAIGSSTPGILTPQRVPGIVPKPERRLTIRDLIPSRPTTDNAVEFVQENVFTNTASPQTEASAKAESALTFTITSKAVRTIAHWIPASRQILADLIGLRAFIDRRLLYGLKLKEETELLNGDNLGDHLHGLTVQATAYAGTYAQAGDTKLDKLRHMILEAEVIDELVSGIVLNPIDWERIELLKTEEGGANKGTYIVGEPRGSSQGLFTGVPTLWGKPVVVTNSMASGKALVGAFATQAEIFDRMEATIDVSTEHSDYFVKNLVAIRAEERLVLAVYRPTAFIYGSI